MLIEYYFMSFFETNVLQFLGVEIRGIDCSKPLNFQESCLLLDNFHQYHLLIIKEQQLTEEKLIQISQLFGEPVPSLLPSYRLEKFPVITKHTNAKDTNKSPIGAMAPEDVYHSDSYFSANPSKATLLYSLKSPAYGGETCFANMCFAYETLDESIKHFIADKKAIYKNAYINQPPVAHPLVRVHSVTQKKALFANIHRALGIDALEKNEALSLLEELYEHAINPRFIYKHKWQDGDLLIWNNPVTMHCATHINDSQERLLYRILTKGDLPVV